jgi:CheY-like chemotaxis protein
MTNNGKRILVAEDDRFLRRGCENSLLKKGYTVTLAADGEEAMQAIRAQAPDLVLLDLLMPKVMGMEVLRFLKSQEATRNIPVLILTNSSKESDVAEILKLGADGYMIKANLSLEELGKQVKQLLKE